MKSSDWALSVSENFKNPSSENQEMGSLFLPSWPKPLRELLSNRGFQNEAQVDEFFSSSIQNLKNPLSLLGAQKACERLAEALKKNQKICIYADFDLDGTSGCALLKKALSDLGFQNLLAHQPRRLKDGYGFHAPIVEELKNQNVDLILTCDVGITANKAVARANELGVDVIITDHHLPAGELPAAFVIVNPNQEADTSGLGYLSGAGVAFTLMRALKRHLMDQKIGTPENLDLKDLLDCFTIATLTDMVPLIEDNRSLVQLGLKQLSATKRPGLSALLQNLGLGGKSLSSSDVAIRFAPKLNALSRLDGEVLPLDLYLAPDAERAQKLVEQAVLQNQQRVQLQAEALKEALQIAEEQSSWPFHFVFSENFHRGVVGLIATSLSQASNKPSFVASLDKEEGKMVGSARLPDGIDHSLVEALAAADEHLLRHGGHARAAGFELAQDSVEGFTQSLGKYFSSSGTQTKKIFYDAHLNFKDFNFELLQWMEKLEPFGVGFERPVFLIEDVRLEKFQSLKGGHLKLTFIQHAQTREGVLFSPTAKQKELIERVSSHPEKKLDILSQVQAHEWRGRKSLQLLIEDVRVLE